MKYATSFQELDSLGEGLSKDYLRKSHKQNELPFDIEGFITGYLGLTIIYENFAEDVDKAREYEASVTKADCDASKLPIGAAEYDKIVKAVNNYNKLIAEAVKEYGEKEVKIEFEPLTEDAFAKLMSGNDWSIGVASEIGDLISE